MGEWRQIAEYEGRYSVSSDGEVFSHLSNKVLSQNIGITGYHTVELFDGSGKSKRLLVHRIVALAFIPNPDNLPQINHKDENKGNNCVDNLEWCTAKYNMNYGLGAKIRHTLIDYEAEWRKALARKNGRAASKPVDQFLKDGTLIASYASGAEASSKTGFNRSHILECCNGKRYKTVGGYIWKFRKVV